MPRDRVLPATAIPALVQPTYSRTIRGEAGPDTLIGGRGDDSLFGLGGNDMLSGGRGDDLLDGGRGNDTATYAGARSAVRVDLSLDGPQDTGQATGRDTLTGIENLIGGDAGDRLTGSGGANRIEGGDGRDRLGGNVGNDRLFGGNGRDLLSGGRGNDLLSGGAGQDTASYAEATRDVTVDLTRSGPQATGRQTGRDTLVDIENLVGGSGRDRLTGNDAANRIDGRVGRDRISGNAGDDRLYGGTENDALTGGSGNDRLFGGRGIDTAVFSGTADEYSIARLPGNRIAITGTVENGNGRDILQGIEILRFGDRTLALSARDAPVFTGIADDSGLIGDGVTQDANLRLFGEAAPGALVQVRLQGVTIGTATAGLDGRWSLDHTDTTLLDGAYRITLRSTFIDGTRSGWTDAVTVTVDTGAPQLADVALAASSDTGVQGDGRTAARVVTLVGTGTPGEVVTLAEHGLSTLVGADGRFALSGVVLEAGNNRLRLTSTDVAGNSTEETITIRRLTDGDHVDPVLLWNEIALDTLRDDATAPAQATRALAMQSIAIMDVLAALDGTAAFMVGLEAPPGADVGDAVAAAAHAVLSHLFPGQQAALDVALAAGGRADAASAAFGRDVAEAVIAIRDSDGWNDFTTYGTAGESGQWQPTMPAFAPAEAPHWAGLDTFVLDAADQFRPDAPPALDSAAYLAAWQQVRDLGAADSGIRTADQTEQARFWADGLGSYTPPGHWNQIALEIAAAEGLGTADAARLMAVLNVALADASIAAWDVKYTYGLWRPVDAIQDAETDGVAGTVADPGWQPLLITPAHPEYVSGHSTYSWAAAAVLEALLGNRSFSTGSVALPGVIRSFDSFAEAATEAGFSRILAGLHYQFSNEAGADLGRDIAEWTLDAFDGTTDSRAPVIIVTGTDGAVRQAPGEVSGFALDNLAGLESLEISLDGTRFRSVTVAADGRFTVDLARLFPRLVEGEHTLVLRAADAVGNVSDTAAYRFTLDRTGPALSVAGLDDGTVLDGAARLTGTVDGTGSGIVSLSYAFDGGTARPVLFNAATGGFDASLDTAGLTPGAHVLRINATDAAGLTTVTEIDVSVPADRPFTVTRLMPADAATDVSVTFRPEIDFSRAVDASTLTPDSFYASDAAGQRLDAQVVLSENGRKAWLWFDEPLPGGTTITLHLVGDAIRAAGDGTALDADGNGLAGGLEQTLFTTVSTEGLAGTVIEGFVVGPGADLRPMTYDDFGAGADGAAFTADDVFRERLEGVRVFVLGHEDRAVLTDANGFFRLEGVPSGTVVLAIDGRTATNAPDGVFYPEMVMDLDIRPGVVNTIMGSMGTPELQASHQTRGEVYLPRLSSGMLVEIAPAGETRIGLADGTTRGLTAEQAGQVQLVVQGGTVLGSNGQVLEGAQVGIATVPAELVRDMLPPGLMQHTFDLTIQAPDAAVFATPLQLTLPNVFNAPPGTRLNLLSFDHNTGRLIIDGTGTVSADGLTVTTDPGEGVTRPGWHGMTPPGTPVRSPRNEPREPDDECAAEGDAIDGVNDGLGIVADLANCLKLFPLSKAVLLTIDIGRLMVQSAQLMTQIAVSVRDANAAIRDGESVDALRAILEGLQTYKSRLIDLVEFASEIGARANPLVDGVTCAKALVQTAEQFVEWAREDACGEASPALDALQAALLVARVQINKYDLIVTAFEDGLKAFVGEAACVALEHTIDALNIYIDARDAEQASANSLADGMDNDDAPASTAEIGGNSAVATAEESIQDMLVQLEAQLTSGAQQADSANNMIEGVDPNTIEGMSELGATLVVHATEFGLDAVGNAGGGYYYMFEVNGQRTRGYSDGSGIEAFLRADAEYVFYAFDPVTGLFAIQRGITAASGSATELVQLVFARPSDIAHDLTDSDGDGLVALAESIIGSNAALADTDGDGIVDGTEMRDGTDPLGGFLLPTGVAGALDLGAEALAIEIATDLRAGRVALVALGSADDAAGGVALVDISAPLTPRLLARLTLDAMARDVAVDAMRGLGAVATDAGLVLVEFSDTAAPVTTVVGNVSVAQVEVLDGVVYALSGNSLVSYDIADGTLIGNLPLGGAGLGMAREGSLLYVLDSTGTISILDTADGQARLLGSFDASGLVSGSAPRQIFVAEGILYLPADDGFQGGFATIDLRDPSATTLLSGVDDTSIAGGAIALTGSGQAVIVGTPGGVFGTHVLDVLDLSDPTDTAGFVTRIDLADAPRDVALTGGFAYVVDAAGRLQVVNYLSRDTAGQAPEVTLDLTAFDLDPTQAGIQVLEGSTLSLAPAVTDDVQVSGIELLVNGQPVETDGSFPWDLRAALPLLADGADRVTLQIRATDTGGNVGLSDLAEIELVADTFAPRLLDQTLTAGAVLGQSSRSFRFNFDEPLADAVTAAAAVRLQLADGSLAVAEEVSLRDGGRTLVVRFPPLPLGEHALIFDPAAISDRADNAMTGAVQTLPFEVVAFTTEWIATGMSHWGSAFSWSAGAVPDATDEVFLGSTVSDSAINFGYYSATPYTVGTLTSAMEMFTVDSHSLIVAGNVIARGLGVGAYAQFDVGGRLTADVLDLSGYYAMMRLRGGATLDRLEMQGGRLIADAALVVQSGGSLRSMSIDWDHSGTLMGEIDLRGGTLAVSGSLQMGGVWDSADRTATIRVGEDARLSLAGATVDLHSWGYSGMIGWRSALIDVAGTLDVGNDARIGGDIDLRVSDGALLRVADGATLTLREVALDLRDGAILDTGVTGRVMLQYGATGAVAGDIGSRSRIHVGYSSTLVLDAGAKVAEIVLQTDAVLQAGDDTAVTDLHLLSSSGIDTGGVLRVVDDFLWDSGEITGVGTLLLEAGGSIGAQGAYGTTWLYLGAEIEVGGGTLRLERGNLRQFTPDVLPDGSYVQTAGNIAVLVDATLSLGDDATISGASYDGVRSAMTVAGILHSDASSQDASPIIGTDVTVLAGGQVDIAAGSLYLQGDNAFGAGSTISVAAGADLLIGGTTRFAGDLGDGSRIGVLSAATVELAAGTRLAEVDLSGTLLTAGDATIGSLAWETGRIAGSGTLTLAAGGTIGRPGEGGSSWMQTAGSIDIAGGTMTLIRGRLSLYDGAAGADGQYVQRTGEIEVQAGATLLMDDEARIYGGHMADTASRLIVAGTLRSDTVAPYDGNYISANLTMETGSLLDLRAGTLSLQGDNTFGAGTTIAVADGAALHLEAGHSRFGGDHGTRSVVQMNVGSTAEMATGSRLGALGLDGRLDVLGAAWIDRLTTVGIIDLAATLTVTQELAWERGSILGAGQIVLEDGGRIGGSATYGYSSMQMAADMEVVGGTLTLAFGNLELWSPDLDDTGAYAPQAGSLRIGVGAELALAAGGSITGTSSAAGQVIVAGLLSQAAGIAGGYISTNLSLTGTARIVLGAESTLRIVGLMSLADGAMLDIAAGADLVVTNLRVDGAVQQEGLLRIESGGLLDLRDGAALGRLMLDPSVEVRLATGAGSLGSVTGNGGTWDVAGELVLADAFILENMTLTGGGTVAAAAGGQFDTGSGWSYLGLELVVDADTVLVEDHAFYLNHSDGNHDHAGRIMVTTGATLDLRGEGTDLWANVTSADAEAEIAMLTIDGTLRRSGDGTTTIASEIVVTGDGRIVVDDGTLEFWHEGVLHVLTAGQSFDL